ncbi:MAG: LysR substrate-binding domain-containing protein [Pseudomonadota bacterium]
MSRNPIRRFLRHGMLPQLAVFEAAARLGSFARAAEELHLAQPTVSIQMRKLAEAIGLPLFEQIGRKTSLTQAGRLLYEGCRELFAELERIERALSALRGLEAGELRLAVSTTGKYFAPRLLAAFVARYPGVEVTLEIHNRHGLIARLAENRDDLYIFANPPQDHELVSQVILPNPMVAFARADHPLVRERAIPFARFAAEPFLMREAGSGTRLVAEELFARHGIAPRVRMELSTNEAVKQAILAGLGVSIMSRYTLGLDTESAQLAALDVQGLPVERPWQIVYPVGKQVSPAAQAFMTLVRDEARRLVYEHLGRNGRHGDRGSAPA